MTTSSFTRRQTLSALTATAGAAVLAPSAVALPASAPVSVPAATPPFILCLNMSTIRGQKLGFAKELEIASKAGFRSVEIWVDSLQDYLKSGGTLADVRQRLKDLGLTVEDAIGFASWIVDDEAARTKGLDQMKRDMELMAQVGCKRIAAPPVGATTAPGLDLRKAGERYRAILELSDQTGVVPQLEMWGFSSNLSRVSEVMFVALESGHPSARLLLDIYHLYKGNNPPTANSPNMLPFVGKTAIDVFHLNDYTAQPPRATIVDADRIYPGDGIAPIRDILKSLKNPAKSIVLSLELFNKAYYAQDALLVAKTGLEKMKAVVAGI